MAEAIERLKTALDEFRARPRAFALRKAMGEMKEALPSAFDAKNEKKKGPHEQEAYDLYQECEGALKGATPTSTVVKRKRSRSEGEMSDANEETKCAQFSSPMFLLLPCEQSFSIRAARPEKKHKPAAEEQEGPAVPDREKVASLEDEDAMDIDKAKVEYSFALVLPRVGLTLRSAILSFGALTMWSSGP